MLGPEACLWPRVWSWVTATEPRLPLLFSAQWKALSDRTISPPACQVSAVSPWGRVGGTSQSPAIGSQNPGWGSQRPLWFAPGILGGPVAVEGQGGFRLAGQVPLELSGQQNCQVCRHWEWGPVSCPSPKAAGNTASPT